MVKNTIVQKNTETNRKMSKAHNKSYRKQEFIAYSDGSCDNLNPARPGGAAYLIMDTEGNIIKKKSKGFINTTNNRMEMLAILSIVNSLPNNSFVTINTDSEYCITALLSKHPKANLDLIQKYYSLRQQKNVTVFLHHVKGHAGNPYNEECDRMARAEYAKMLSKSKKKRPKMGKISSGWNDNKLEEMYYSQVTTKYRKRNSKKKKA